MLESQASQEIVSCCVLGGKIYGKKLQVETAKNDIMGTMGNERFAMAAKKICKACIPYKMTIKINQAIPYKMKVPNPADPAKFSNCMSSFLYDRDSTLKSSTLLLLQYVKVQVGSLQNGL